MFLASAHQTPHRDDRRVHDTQLAVAGQEGEPPEQKGHGTGDLKRRSTIAGLLQYKSAINSCLASGEKISSFQQQKNVRSA